MAATPEKKVKSAIKKILDDAGVYYAMPIGSGYGGNNGVPDFLICAYGHFIGVEAKAGKGRTTLLQDQHILRIRTAGGIAFIINEDNLHVLRRVLDDLGTMDAMRAAK